MDEMNHIKVVHDMLSRGEEPTVEQMAEALQQSMDELSRFRTMATGLGVFLGKLAIAHVAKDTETVNAALDQFVKEKVLFRAPDQNHNLH